MCSPHTGCSAPDLARQSSSSAAWEARTSSRAARISNRSTRLRRQARISSWLGCRRRTTFGAEAGCGVREM